MNATRGDIKVCVLQGGTSREREVSLNTGAAMARAAIEAGFAVSVIDFGPDRIVDVVSGGFDVVLLALHGGYGEAGSVQGLLNCARIPYTGAGVMASSLAMDKVRSKRLCAAAGVRTPEYGVLSAARATEVLRALEADSAGDLATIAPEIPSALFDGDYVVKPSCEGSSVGVSLVIDGAIGGKSGGDGNALATALRAAVRGNDDVLVERYVAGPELSVGIFGGEVLGTVEIVPADGFYDYEAKYLSKTTEYRVPPRISAAATEATEAAAKRVYEVIGCRGVARIDFLLDSADRPWLLELNTLPGMTETSLVPKLAAARGESFEDLVARIIDAARVDEV